MTFLVLWPVRIKKAFTRTGRESVNNERPTIFEKEYFARTNVPIWHALVRRSSLQFYLFLLVATLLLLDLHLALPIIKWNTLIGTIYEC